MPTFSFFKTAKALFLEIMEEPLPISKIGSLATHVLVPTLQHCTFHSLLKKPQKHLPKSHGKSIIVCGMALMARRHCG